VLEYMNMKVFYNIMLHYHSLSPRINIFLVYKD